MLQLGSFFSSGDQDPGVRVFLGCSAVNVTMEQHICTISRHRTWDVVQRWDISKWSSALDCLGCLWIVSCLEKKPSATIGAKDYLPTLPVVLLLESESQERAPSLIYPRGGVSGPCPKGHHTWAMSGVVHLLVLPSRWGIHNTTQLLIPFSLSWSWKEHK